MNYEVILYYKFTPIADPQAFRDWHQKLCVDLELKGRVYVADEGINGTLAGTPDSIAIYKDTLRKQSGLADIEFKIDFSERIPFAKLKTKVRQFILNMGLSKEHDINPAKITGNHLSPKQWRETLEKENDFILLDVRNNYESTIGHFENAICPDIHDFQDFPAWADKLKEEYSDKKILMYCTGGIRCEKFSGLLLEKGFKDVNQLHGGILNYAKEENGAHFDGRCFVFDDRLAVDIAQNTKPIAHCQFCNTPEDRYVNCANMACNRLFLVCDTCAETHAATCSQECQESATRRPFDKKNFRIPFRKKGVVFPELGRRQKEFTLPIKLV